MKKFLSLMLTICLLLGLCACGGSGDQSTEPAKIDAFSVGYAKADISPKESAPLGGYSNAEERWSTNVVDPLELVCVAFTDEEGETVLFFVADLLMAYDNITKDLKTAVSQATGISKDHIIYHVTHNHSGPQTNLVSIPAIVNYNKMHTESAVQIAQEALADRKAAQMETAYARLQGYNTVRHYLLADGSFKGEGVGSVAKDQIIGHTAAPDNLMQVVRFTREGGKDVVLMNWQGHPNGYDPYGETSATSTLSGATRKELAAALDCLPVYILGGSGNLNNNSQIKGEVAYETYPEMAKALAGEAAKALESAKPAATDKIQLKESVLTLSDNQSKMKDLPICAFSVGDLAFITAPSEIFCNNSVAVREQSKFPMTIYASVSNGQNGYMPTPKPFEYNAYEVRITKFPMGTAETIQNEQTKLLDELFTAGGYTEAEKPEGYLTPEFVPVTDGVEYINPEAGNLGAVREVQNGYYAFVLLNGTTVKNMLAVDKETAEKVIMLPSVKLLFNEQNVVVDVAS